MLRRYALQIVATVIITGSLLLQTDVSQSSEKFINLPRETALPVIVFQPGCPVSIEEISIRAFLGGGGGIGYKVTNHSDKAIDSLEIATIFLDGGSKLWGVKADSAKMYIMPKASISHQVSLPKHQQIEIDSQLAEKLDLKKGLNGVAILMATRVSFVDGTSYNDESVYNALLVYVERNIK